MEFWMEEAGKFIKIKFNKIKFGKIKFVKIKFIKIKSCQFRIHFITHINLSTKWKIKYRA